jgi:hypothetical protein
MTASRVLIDMPRGASVLSAALDPAGMPAIWALVDPDQPVEKRQVEIYGTGRTIPMASAPSPRSCSRSRRLVFVGTFQNGAFVAHVFDAGAVT